MTEGPTAAPPTPPSSRRRPTPTVGKTLVLLGLAGFALAAAVSFYKTTGSVDPAPPDPGNVASDTAEPAAPATENVSSPQAVLDPADAGKQNDKGWVLESFRLTGSSSSPSAVARIKNANTATSTGIFTVTILNGTTPLVTFQGVANSVTYARVVTVQMFSQDQMPAGSTRGQFSYEFQTDASTPT